MIKIALFVWFFVCLYCLSYVVHALAFPGAVGFGRDTTGGRGGNIYIVTNTSSNAGTGGSFPWAISQAGPRVIVFKTGGVIDSTPDIPANTTIMCQTAPGDGVAFDGTNWRIGNNVIIRGCRYFTTSSSSRNGPNFSRSTDIIMDHSSVAWVGNENTSSWQNEPYSTGIARRVTLSYNAFYEGLYNSNTSRDCPGGGNWEGHGLQMAPTTETTIYRNLIVNIRSRIPHFAGPVFQAEFINNMIFHNGPSSGGASIVADNSGNANEVGTTLIHYISNVFKNTNSITANDGGVPGGFTNDSAVYWTDNIPVVRQTSGADITFSNSPVFTSLLSSSDIVPRGQVQSTALSEIGPIPRSVRLDRAVSDYLNENKRWQCPEDLPSLSFSPGSYAATYGADSDSDGIPDSFETANGLNPNNANDADNISSNGYMWIEEWANSLFGSTPGEPEPTIPDRPAWFSISG